ncbi:ABC transporter permease [Mesorhizobium sp. M1339]|uniref:ABC transporter permease n=1 Tax=Mesorhizobium sp. M1339 TaxID=2957086 RepID=UPI00333C1D5B
MYTRMMFGARNTIGIALVTTLIAFLFAVPTALYSSLQKGWMDQLISRAVDVVLALPTLIVSLGVISILGSSIPVLVIVISFLNAASIFRVCRAVAVDINEMDFVEIAKLRGEPRWWLMWGEIFPNVLPPLLAEFGVRFCYVFLFISSLSFLGLGIQPPTADWGSMVRENGIAISYGIMTPLLPALAIAVLTVAVNLVVDWLLHKASGSRELI